MPLAPDHEPLLRLLLGGVPASVLRRLLDTHGDAATTLDAGPRDWASHGADRATCAAVQAPDAAALDRCLRWLEGDRHHLLGWRDEAYPPLLRRIASPPALLFVAGDPGLLWRPAVAVVGSRAATAGGRANAAAFAAALARAGLCVASGMAAGIDAAAHDATLEAGGMTVAVLGTGPDIAYPASHRPLMARIAQAGAVVSEHPPGTAPLRTHFPSRNRILVGLSLGVLVVEAALRSGALITARQAGDAGREVFALPGSIHNPMARGCHRLIRDGAQLVETPAEVLDALAPLVGDLARALRGVLEHSVPTEAPPSAVSFPDDPDTYRLWQALGHDPTDMDELLARTGLTAATVSSILLALELEGRVAAEHGRYSRVGV
jgi:DNA processing protein